MDRQEIIDTALQVAREKGWEKTSVREISRNISYSTIKIYSDFGSKDQLLHEIQVHGFHLLKDAYLKSIRHIGDPTEQLVVVSLSHFQFAREQKILYDLMFQLNGANCAAPIGYVMRETSAPIREILSQIHPAPDPTLFLNWWSIVHGFVVTTDSIRQMSREEASMFLEKIIRRFISSIQS